MISKKASVASIKFVQDKYGAKISNNSNWEDVFNVVTVGHHCNVYSMADGTTRIQLCLDGEKAEVIQEFFIPNTELFNPDTHEWDEPYIYKTVVEWMMKKNKRVKKVKFNTKQIETRLNELREILKTAKGTTKRKAVQEYNDLSKALALAPKPAPKEKKPVVDVKELRRRRDNLSVRIWDWKKKGKDTTELERELDSIKQQIKNKKA